MPVSAAVDTYDLLVRWPGDRRLSELDRRKTFAVHGYPRHWDLGRRAVWVAQDGKVVRDLRIDRISNEMKRLEIAGTVPSSHGHRLHIRTSTALEPLLLKHVRGSGWPHTFPNPATIRYVLPDPFEVVTITPRASAPFRVPIEVARIQSVVVENQREHLAQFQERHLVRMYQDWLGRRVDSYVIPTKVGALRTDAFDDERNLLIEAKSNVERPSLRMAVGQLWDYARQLPSAPLLAVLLPAKPDVDGMAFLESCGVGVIWRTAAGFHDNVV